MDVRFINPFLASIKNVFKTMVEVEVRIGTPRTPGGASPKADVSSIVGFSGDVVGSVAMCFPLSTAVSVAGKFARCEMTQEHPDFADAIGELANMVAGNAKSRFQDLTVSISLPRVVIGKDLRLLGSRCSPALLLPCESDLGPFSVELVVEVETGLANSSSRTTTSAPA